REAIQPHLPRPGQAARIRLRVPPREIPLVRGYRNEGLRFIEERTGARVKGVVADASVPSGQVRTEEA
ncbi:MAG: hypothetical protein JW821_06145, partial [Deltaproteobacteria bacterium]|nr:hypothetical protein [Deltaproteobacteria bacterium]